MDKTRATMNVQLYAVVLAHLEHFRSTDSSDVLRALDVDPREWREADVRLTAELALAAKRHESRRALLFTSVFHRTRRALMAAQPTLEVVASERARAQAPRTGVLASAPAPGVAPALATAPRASAIVPAVAGAGRASPWSATAGRSEPPSAPPPGSVDETVIVTALVDDEPLPFEEAGGPGAGMPPRAAAEVVAEGRPMAGKTSSVPFMGDAIARALPFAKRPK
jgi:hypothetical protein